MLEREENLTLTIRVGMIFDLLLVAIDRLLKHLEYDSGFFLTYL